ncbi:MAG TPA: glycosyltransferase family 2 protein [Candidatus Omnitrophota bacterium]|nr:glycosyltransferase family 2 protein [Candidatus Omnitrophota bacterium]
MHKFSIIIASWNRRQELVNSIEKLERQAFKDFEVIVVDNGSEDGTAGLIGSNYPRVKLVRSEINLGSDAYNVGFKYADGQYIIFMDNDAFFKEDALERADYFFKVKKADILAFNVIDINNGVSETGPLEKDACFFHGAAVAIERHIIEKLGGYDSRYFIMHTDLELSTRYLNNGYKILYDKDTIAFHSRSSRSRLGKEALFYSSRNALFYYWTYYPFPYALLLSVRELFYGLSRSFKEKAFFSFFNGFLKGAVSIPFLKKRTIADHELYLRMKLYLDSYLREPVIKKLMSNG